MKLEFTVRELAIIKEALALGIQALELRNNPPNTPRTDGKLAETAALLTRIIRQQAEEFIHGRL